ncbi:substrate-binding domain-containing protein [Deltaproteobacteria bacterium]|nr:substrate-binding domain-containing protein [Deltaproteobacteria bacterium]
MKDYYISCFAMIILLLSSCFSYAGNDEKGIYDAVYGEEGTAFTVATGSPGSLGLLKALAEPFCGMNNCRINWLNMGSGESLNALKEGKAEMIMVHSPQAEKKAVQEGWAVNRTLLGGNEFFIIGPESDPAGIGHARSAKQAFIMIANAGAKFFSRGDNSGTHKKEMMIWEDTGINPDGTWYVVTGDLMWPTLSRCDYEQGYFMTDSSTFIAKKTEIKNLKVLFRGDPMLINLYHAIAAPEGKTPKKIYSLISKFIAFIETEEGQKILRDYGKEECGFELYMDLETARNYEQ